MKNSCVIFLLALLISACQQSEDESQQVSTNVIEAQVQASDNQTTEKQVVNNESTVEVETGGAQDEMETIEQPFEFSYLDLDQNEVNLSDYRGKWVIVNYWATWCPPCRKEMPDFVRFKEDFADKVEIIGIDNEDAEDDVIRAFVEEYEINYPIVRADVYDPSDFDRENTMGLPTTVVFNPQGYQVAKRVGPVHYDELVEMVGFKVDSSSLDDKEAAHTD